MDTETKCMIAEAIGEAMLGGAIGVGLVNHVYPKCDSNTEKVIMTLGTMVGSWMIGRAFGKQFYKFCDSAFDTDFEDIIDSL